MDERTLKRPQSVPDDIAFHELSEFPHDFIRGTPMPVQGNDRIERALKRLPFPIFIPPRCRHDVEVLPDYTKFVAAREAAPVVGVKGRLQHPVAGFSGGRASGPKS